MTTAELAALVEILNRCPMTQGERLWVQALIERLSQEAQIDEDKRNNLDGNLGSGDVAG